LWFEKRDDVVEQLRGALDTHDLERAARLARKATRKWKDDAEVWLLAGYVALDLESPSEALLAFDRAVALDAKDVAGRLGRVEALLDLARAGEALDAAKAAAVMAPDDAEAHHLLATSLELLGRQKEADRAYAAAARLDPEGFPAPMRVPRKVFDRLTQKALDMLPDHVHDAMENIHIGVKDYPGPEDQIEGEQPLSLRLLGVFQGSSLREQTTENPWTIAAPALITLFQRNLERACRTRAELTEQITITVFHEVGHYLGMDEDEIHGRGLG
jgi:predicted Zn-dependent protease with MMP-like domain